MFAEAQEMRAEPQGMLGEEPGPRRGQGDDEAYYP